MKCLQLLIFGLIAEMTQNGSEFIFADSFLPTVIEVASNKIKLRLIALPSKGFVGDI